MTLSAPSWTALYQTADLQAGHVTTRQAADAGYSPQLIHKHLASGRLVRVHRGIYRLVHYPSSDLEDLVVHWLWSGHEGVLSHETALFLHELSDVLPDTVTMTVPTSWRRRRLSVPEGLRLEYADLDGVDRAWHGPIPVTTPLRTLVDVHAASISPEHVERAAADGVARGLFTEGEVGAILAADHGAPR
ncbi:MAG: type IV toxin-antitoxin system AbiEi family antitoxin domain-containing protein [Alphaproteobacteria bacterium]|nr:type IV toxin-antitoxin system AbiEi family antitoxin domain-containing protein [Alphaproteobacteria bacterium]